jgi:hypothetical protein
LISGHESLPGCIAQDSVGFTIEDTRIAREQLGVEPGRFIEDLWPKCVFPPPPDMEDKPGHAAGTIVPQEKRQQLDVMENAGNQEHGLHYSSARPA